MRVVKVALKVVEENRRILERDVVGYVNIRLDISPHMEAFVVLELDRRSCGAGEASGLVLKCNPANGITSI